jgi:small subunit ribosomal protein S19
MLKRSSWKLPFISPVFLRRGLVLKKRAIKSRIRNSIIPMPLTSKSFHIYNGKTYLPVVVKPLMKGYKFGEFSFTKILGYKKKKKNKKKR